MAFVHALRFMLKFRKFFVRVAFVSVHSSGLRPLAQPLAALKASQQVLQAQEDILAVGGSPSHVMPPKYGTLDL